MEPLKTDNESLLWQYQAIIKAILREIQAKEISIIQFCDDSNIDLSEFLDSLNEVKADFSYYLKVLEMLKNY